MQFKYPEILYALFLLLIPIIVHLFQLRRFEKVAFTNVKFLKKLELQTRKSAKLKKFLILLSRLGLFTALIVAFAQPYKSNNHKQLEPQTLIYLDNSFSMQAKNGSKELFKNATQDLISHHFNDEAIHILTNNDAFKVSDNKALKNQLLSLDYHPSSQDLNTILLQAKKLNPKQKGQQNHLILISDFQQKNLKNISKLDSTTLYSFVQLQPQKNENIALDSVFIRKQNGAEITLNAIVKNYRSSMKTIAVSLFKDNILVGKSSVDIIKNKKSIATFKIKFDKSFNGKITLEDHLLPFDNKLFFSIQKPEVIKVLAIGNDNRFLSKIYNKPEFKLESKKINQLDYNNINSQNLIILNELKSIPVSLQKLLNDFVLNGGSLTIIPSNDANINNYNQFFNTLKVGSIAAKIKAERSINTINFSHPLLDNVFEKQVKNFQYPNVKSSFSANFKKISSVLKYDNQKSFISQQKIGKGNLYWISAPINQANSNFKNSPLIVPVFYNFGKQSFNVTKLFYTIGKSNKIDVSTSIKKEEIVHITGEENFIPLQIVNQDKVSITTDDNPSKAGFYTIKKGDMSLKNIAFNYSRDESDLSYATVKDIFKNDENVSFSNSIKQTFENINTKYKSTSFWKWFIGLALLFLIIELFLIKFLK
ncbi:MAG: BatA domain-containing protein [Flavobacteriaceae bacterium]